MKDKEYMQAFLNKLANYHADIFVEVIDLANITNITNITNTDSCTIMLTDYDARSIEQTDANRFSAQILFLVNKVPTSPNNYLFKYQSFNNLLADIAGHYKSLTGDRVRYSSSSRLICICGDCIDFNYKNVSKSIVSKLKYSKGGEYLLISASPLNNYGYYDEIEKGRISRLIYSIDSGKEIELDEFFRVDEYGVHYLSMGIGLNRIALLEWDELNKLITNLSKYFTGIVVDIGTCFSPQNIKLMNEADSLWWISDAYTDLVISQLVSNSEEKEITILDRHMDDMDMMIDEIINQGDICD